MYLKVVISKQISSIVIGGTFIILEDGGGEHTLKCKEKNSQPLFQSSKITDDKTEN